MTDAVPMTRGRYYPFNPERIPVGAAVDYRDDSDYEPGEEPDDQIWHDAEARLSARALYLRDWGGGYIVTPRAQSI